MTMKQQTVYIPIDRPSHGSEYTLTCNRGDKYSFEVECLPNHYCLSKEQLIELLGNAFDAGIKIGENNVFFNKVTDLNEDAPIKSTWIKQLFS